MGDRAVVVALAGYQHLQATSANSALQHITVALAGWLGDRDGEWCGHAGPRAGFACGWAGGLGGQAGWGQAEAVPVGVSRRTRVNRGRRTLKRSWRRSVGSAE